MLALIGAHRATRRSAMARGERIVAARVAHARARARTLRSRNEEKQQCSSHISFSRFYSRAFARGCAHSHPHPADVVNQRMTEVEAPNGLQLSTADWHRDSNAPRHRLLLCTSRVRLSGRERRCLLLNGCPNELKCNVERSTTTKTTTRERLSGCSSDSPS